MKKFVVLLVVVALTFISAIAYAADVTVGGTVQIRSRNFDTMSFDEKVVTKDEKDTQERIQMDINAKAGDVKGKIAIWNDFDTWGRFEAVQGIASGTTVTTTAGDSTQTYNNNKIGIREAWVNFNVPGLPINVTAGHQLLKLANGFFVSSMHFGSDAWVIANQTGNNTFAVVNGKIAENTTSLSDDQDLYTILDVFKLSDNATIGVDFSNVKDRSGADQVDLMNVGINFNGKIGPVALKAQFDQNMGDKTTGGTVKQDFTGNEIVVQGKVPIAPVTLNFTFAMGSGQDTSSDVTLFQNFLDVDPHVAFMYEYKIPTAAGRKNTGFANTTAIGVGATMAASSSVTVGADLWLLSASEKVNVTQTGRAAGAVSDDVGTEIDLAVNWKVAENLTWNWNVGYFMPGDAYLDATGAGDDAATGITGILAFKF